MHYAFGFATLGTSNDGFTLSALGLNNPIQLAPSTTGVVVPDLTDHLGKLIRYSGAFATPTGNLEKPELHFIDLQLAPEGCAVTPAYCTFCGNLGGQPSPNPAGDRITGSIAYASSGDNTSWVRAVAYNHTAVAPAFAQLEKGARILISGELEAFTYSGKPRVQISLIAFDHLPKASAPPEAPTVLASSFAPGTASDPAVAF